MKVSLGKVAILLVSLFYLPEVYSYTVTVQNMVGISSGTGVTTVPLATKIKKTSDYVPLYRIDITTPTTSGEQYILRAVTVTIRNISNFNPVDDLLPLPAGLVVIPDSQNGTTSTPAWDGYQAESAVLSANYTPTEWTGSSPWTVHLQFTNQPRVDQSNRTYTYYVCVRTGTGITDSDSFRAEIDNTGEVIVDLYDTLQGTTNYYRPTTGTATSLVADTVAPMFTLAYTPDSARGTTPTVLNLDNYNIYTTTTIAQNTMYAKNKIRVEVNLGENSTSLADSIWPVADLFTLDTTAFDGANKSNSKSVSYIGNFRYRLTYELMVTTVNSPTVSLPFRIKLRDAAGNESTGDDSYRVFIDLTPPELVNIVSPAVDSWVSEGKPFFSWSPVTDPNLDQYLLIYSSITEFTNFLTDNTKNFRTVQYTNTTWGTINNWTTIAYPSSSPDTYYYWNVVAIDKAGNLGVLSNEGRRFKFDTTVPNVYAETPTGAITNSQPTITVKIDDAVKGTIMAGIEFSTLTLTLNNERVTVSTQTVDVTTTVVTYTPTNKLADGTYTVNLWVRDNVGNINQKKWTFMVDTTPPESKDTDNDGYSDRNEIINAKNPNDPTSKPAGTADFYPVNNELVNATLFYNTYQSKIRVRIDEIIDTYNSGVDTGSVASSISITSVKGNESYYTTLDYLTATACSLYIQLTRTLSTVGTDDGLITVKYTPRDKIGNAAAVQTTRTFVYDTQPPTISTITAPNSGDTQTGLVFTVNVVDTNLVKDTPDAVKLVLWNSETTKLEYNMTKSSDSNYSVSLPPLKEAKTYYYGFTAQDIAGNSKEFPTGIKTDYRTGTPLLITDKTGPETTIYKITTLVGYKLAGVTNEYTSTGLGGNNVKSNPTVYADPVNNLSNDYNIFQATVSIEATEVYFEYKLSTTTSWSKLTTYKTANNVTNNPVWETYWNTTGLLMDAYHDIRVVASDTLGNKTEPVSNLYPGFTTVYLKPSLSPKAKIYTTGLNYPKNAGFVNGDKIVVNAETNTTGNIDISSIKFEVKKLTDTEWKSVATDTDATAAHKIPVPFILDETELPYLMALNNIKISSVTAVLFDEISGGTTYDTVMVKTGSVWSTMVNFPPGTFTYQFKVRTEMDTEITILRDPREYKSNGVNSQVVVNPFSCIVSLTEMENANTFSLRAVAQDFLGNVDTTPEYITLTYDNSKPQAPVITQPYVNQRIMSGSQFNISANLSETDRFVKDVIFTVSKDNGQTWDVIGKDSTATDGWTLSWQTPTVNNDTPYLIGIYTYRNPPKVSTISTLQPVIIDPTGPKIDSFTIVDTTETINLSSGKVYTLKATTVDTDIAPVVFTGTGINGTFSTVTKSGTGTINNPYTYTTMFTPTDTDFVTGTLNVTMTDLAGNNTVKSVTVSVKDTIPTIATLRDYSNDAGVTYIPVTSGLLSYAGKPGIMFRANVVNLDGGKIKFQYATSPTGSWITFDEQNPAATVIATLWNPYNLGIPEGIYYLRALAVDDDNNVDPAPVLIQISLDFKEPKIDVITLTPAGTIDCAKEFMINVKSNDTDIQTITFQYYDDNTSTWINIDDTTAGRMIMAVETSVTPQNIGLTETALRGVAKNVARQMTIPIRAMVRDRANNVNLDTQHTPVLNVNFNDTTAPVAITESINAAGTVFASAGDANVKSIIVQYRVSGTTQPWTDLGSDIVADTTYGNYGTRWSVAGVANLPSGVYEFRAVATDMFNNVDLNLAPVNVIQVQTDTVGNKTYFVQKSKTLSIGITDIIYQPDGSLKLSFEVTGTVPFTNPPRVTLLTVIGANTITKPVTITENNSQYTGSITLDKGTLNATDIRITAEGTTQSGLSLGEVLGIRISAPAQNPTGTTIDGYASVVGGGWTGTLPETTSVIVAPRVTPVTPELQSTLIQPIGRTYEFRLANRMKQFPLGVSTRLMLSYADTDIPQGSDETKLGICYWDENNNRWSADGITNVIINRTANTVAFTVNHFTTFALALINTQPEIKVESPKDNSFTDGSPYISILAEDKFSAIAQIRVDVDGMDFTNAILNFADSDGIDNNGNGIIDEKGGDTNGLLADDEQAFINISPTSAKLTGRLPITLTLGKEHLLTVTSLNVQGQVTVKSIKFQVGDKLSFAGTPYNYPNPFNPRVINTKIVPSINRSAEVELKVYDFKGDEVAYQKKQVYGSSDEIVWDGREKSTYRILADGVYFAKITATSDTETVTKFIKIAVTSK